MKLKKASMVFLLIVTMSTQVKAFDIVNGIISWASGDSSNVMTEYLNQINTCYEFDTSILEIDDMCGLINYDISVNTGICSALPDISYFNKSSNNDSISYSSQLLKDYCGSSTEKLNSITSDAVNYFADESKDGTKKLANGDTLDKYYTERIPEDLTETIKKNSIFSEYLKSNNPNDQDAIDYLVNVGKKISDFSANDDLSSIKPEDVKVTDNMVTYKKDVKRFSASMMKDVVEASPVNISNDLSQSLSTYDNASDQSNAYSDANDYVKKINTVIEETSSQRKGMYKYLLREKDDIAIPTQQTLDLYKPELRARYAAQIKRQQTRDAFVEYMVDSQVQMMKDITTLVSKKSVIMKSRFDESKAKDDIDSLVN